MSFLRAMAALFTLVCMAGGCCYSFPGTDPTTAERAFAMMQYAVARGAEKPPPVDFPNLAEKDPADVLYSLLAYPFRDHYGYFRIHTLGWHKVVEYADALLNMRFDRELTPEELPRPLDWRDGVVAPLKDGVVVRVRLRTPGEDGQVFDYVQLVKETAREEDITDSDGGPNTRYHIVEYQPHSRTWRRIVRNLREGASEDDRRNNDDDWFNNAGEEHAQRSAAPADSSPSTGGERPHESESDGKRAR